MYITITQSYIKAVVKVDQRIRWHYNDYTITIGYFAFVLVHGSTSHEVSKLYGMLALSYGTLTAPASTLYRLVPAHFYPCIKGTWCLTSAWQLGNIHICRCAFWAFRVLWAFFRKTPCFLVGWFFNSSICMGCRVEVQLYYITLCQCYFIPCHLLWISLLL